MEKKHQYLALSFQTMEEIDIPALTPVMKRVFDDDAQKHLGKESGGPPGYDNGDFFRTWLLPYQESVGYKIIFFGLMIINRIPREEVLMRKEFGQEYLDLEKHRKVISST